MAWRKGAARPLILLLVLGCFVCALPILLHYRSQPPFNFLKSSSSSCTQQWSSSLLQQHPLLSFQGDLLSLPWAWNLLSFSLPSPPPLRIALFVKKWPFTSSPGGLERHALTLHKYLAFRGHSVHIFTTDRSLSQPKEFHDHGLHFHLSLPNPSGNFDFPPAWNNFLIANSSHPFDIVHTESVALPAHHASNLPDVVVSWHGIAYEIIHSDIVQDLNRKPGENGRSESHKSLRERVSRVVEEVKFFPSYKHHVATSDYGGDVLRTIYEILPENVHVILNGVDQHKYRPDAPRGATFRASLDVPADARLVFGAAGRLVKDKGYPLLFEAFSEVLKDHKDVYLLIAGDGPWASRFKDLSPNVKVLGALDVDRLSDFYRALDIFVNPTLRAQGLDHTLLEAMLCGKPLMATHFSSITRSIILNDGFGYTFAPSSPSLLKALRLVIKDGKQALERKGQNCFQRASLLFTATKMGSAYERLFLCIKDKRFCQYPMQSDI